MTPRVTVVGLGPAGPDLVTAGTLELIASASVRVLRTIRHPAASLLEGDLSCDDIYESAERIGDVYPAIVERLVGLAEESGDVLYAVPGSPLVAEHTVELLLADPRVETVVTPALSFMDLAWVRLGIDPLAEGVRVIDGHRFASEAAGERGPLLVCQCDTRDVLSDVKLAVDEPPDVDVTVIARLGLSDESIVAVPWSELDRSFEPDHLTSLYIPRLAAPIAAEVQRFSDMVRVLRQQCPWDSEQTHESLVRYLVEETYEVIEAIGTGDPGHLEEELGDLLFQVVIHATIAAEDGWFDLADVARTVHDKLVSRHPHVFGDAHVDGVDDLLATWERQKVLEKGRSSVMDGIPSALPAVLYAAKVAKKATGAGVDPPGVAELVAAVEASEAALRAAIDGFVAEFRRSETSPAP